MRQSGVKVIDDVVTVVNHSIVVADIQILVVGIKVEFRDVAQRCFGVIVDIYKITSYLS